MKQEKVFTYRPERRYAAYPRRYTNEYHVDGRTKDPIAFGRCATLLSARTRAARAVDQGFCAAVRVFDHRAGKYLYTYKAAEGGIARHEGYVK